MRALGLALMAATVLATPASAAIWHVTFEISSDNWMQVTGVAPPYGLPLSPVIEGSFDVDSDDGPLVPLSGIQNLSMQVGTRLYTEADLAGFSFAAFAGNGDFSHFQLQFGGTEEVGQGGARFVQDGNTYACNHCVRITSDVDPIPEPATWALMIMGFGAAGASLRRRRLA